MPTHNARSRPGLATGIESGALFFSGHESKSIICIGLEATEMKGALSGSRLIFTDVHVLERLLPALGTLCSAWRGVAWRGVAWRGVHQEKGHVFGSGTWTV